jgi:nucleoside-diphosphate-sugar epimerase
MILNTNPLAGRIVVVGANSRTGQRLLPHLKGESTYVTALVRHPIQLAADEIIPDWMSNQDALDALANADAVIILTGVFAAADWDTYQQGTVATVQRVVEAVQGRKIPVVYFSVTGADPVERNWYLKSKGLAEQALAALPEAVILRIQPLVHGGSTPTPFESSLLPKSPGAAVRVFGSGTQRRRPLHIDDVVSAAMAALRRTGPKGTYNLGGPDEHSLVELIKLANGHDVPINLVPIEEVDKLPPPASTIADLMSRRAPAIGTEETAAAFNLQLTPLSAIWPLPMTDKLRA